VTRGASVTLPTLLALSLACSGSTILSHSDVLAIQAAAVEFLAKQDESDQDGLAICVRVAVRAGEMVEGLVERGLEDPPAAFVARLRAKGITAQPFSSCNQQVGTLVFAVGWPSVTPDGVEVPADRLCDPLCGGGFKVHVRRTAEGWRAIAAHATWVS